MHKSRYELLELAQKFERAGYEKEYHVFIVFLILTTSPRNKDYDAEHLLIPSLLSPINLFRWREGIEIFAGIVIYFSPKEGKYSSFQTEENEKNYFGTLIKQKFHYGEFQTWLYGFLKTFFYFIIVYNFVLNVVVM